MLYSVTAPAVVIRPMLLVPPTVNQSAPSGPDVMGPFIWGTTNSVMVPLVLMRSILPGWVNQIAPSGPDVIASTAQLEHGYSVIVPLVVIRPIAFGPFTNQSAPSGPVVIAPGSLY